MSGLVPVSSTIQTPYEIMYKHLDSEDIIAMTKYISDYQRTESEWKLYRKKIPGELLEKWGEAFTEWAKEQIRRDEYAEKATPVKVNLGNKDNVVNVLREIAAAVGIESQDVPF